jgi:hypothetical protein
VSNKASKTFVKDKKKVTTKRAFSCPKGLSISFTEKDTSSKVSYK